MIDTNKLRKLTQAATPGPWRMLPIGDGRQKFAVADSEFLSILTVTDEGGATFGTVYDDADAKFIAAANPAAISELIDRLEAAEKETASWKGLAKQFGNEADALRSLVVMRFDHDHPPQFAQGYYTHEPTEPVTAEHCRWFVAEIERLRAEVAHIKEVEFPRKAQAVADGWRGKLEAAEEERDDVAQQLVQSEQGKRKISEECDALSAELSKQQTLTVAAQHIAEVAQRRANQLRAKVAEMEKQPPICRIKDIRRAHYMTKVVGLDPEAWLYALPGAQPAPSIPEAVMEVIAGLVYEVERNICQHEETHRGGQWEICDMCGARWADDMGGKPEFKWPEVVEKARDMLEAAPGAQPAPSFADAYQGAMEEVAIWKKRALEAEALNRKFVAEINGPTYMGEPAQPAASAPSEEAAAEMGANGGHVVEAERLAFEAWMRGHCWKLGAKWTGTEYRSAFEKGGMVDMHAMRTRELWAAWRDRAALAAAPEAKP